jgi:hypothetical protein
MTARLHTRREALGLIGAAAAAGPALAQGGACPFGYWSSCDIDDIAWVNGEVVWNACRICDDGTRREAILRARPGGPIVEIAQADNMRIRPFDDKLYAIDWTQGPRRSLIFSLPDFELIADLDDGGAAYQARPEPLRETLAVLSERLPDITRSRINLRYAVAVERTRTDRFNVWWMETGHPETFQQVAHLFWSPGLGDIDVKFQSYDGSTLVSPFYGSRWRDVPARADGMPVASVYPDGTATVELIPDSDILSTLFNIGRIHDGFAAVVGSSWGDTYDGLYKVEGNRWRQVNSLSVDNGNLQAEPGGTRLAWGTREKLPLGLQKQNGLWTWRHELHVTEI